MVAVGAWETVGTGESFGRSKFYDRQLANDVRTADSTRGSLDVAEILDFNTQIGSRCKVTA